MKFIFMLSLAQALCTCIPVVHLSAPLVVFLRRVGVLLPVASVVTLELARVETG